MSLTNHLNADKQANGCLTTLSLMVFTQINFVADFLRAKCDFSRKWPFCFFERPFGGLGATYAVHIRLTEKRVVDFLLVYWTFLLNVTAEALRANIDWKSAISLQRGQLDPKFQVEGVAPTKHSSCHKARMNNLSCGIRMWAQVSFVLSQITRLTDRRTDGRTGGRTALSWQDRVACYTRSNACSAVKTTAAGSTRQG